jgi:polyferredoxin
VLEVLRDRNPTFVRLKDGSIRDGYTLKVDNRSFEPRQFTVDVTGLANARVESPGATKARGPLAIIVQPNETRSLRVFIVVPPSQVDNMARSQPVDFTISQPGGKPITTPSTFLSGDVTPS